MAQTFSKRRRLRSQSEFRGIQKRSARLSHGNLLLLAGRSPREGSARLGLVVSRKVGTAVKRNAVKRWIREWFRTQGQALPWGVDLVVVAKPGAAERGHRALVEDLASLVRRLSGRFSKVRT